MPELRTTRCFDCETLIGSDLICPDCLLHDLETLDFDQAKRVLEQMSKDLSQQLEEIKRRQKLLGMKI
jgi:hypothetical protein